MENMINPDENFQKLGLELPPAPKPLGVYKPAMIVGNFIYLSGHGPVKTDGSLMKGRIGSEIDMEEGKLVAQQVGLTMLSTLKDNLGSLSKVKRVIKVLGMVNCTDDFQRQPYIINGASELFAKVWGDDLGIGVRSAVGVNTLPDNISVEIEAIFELA
ncbi:MAG: hypothetical protein RIR51_2060 [Bacteroidota bacterium]|jgi:enamine deaminase RidA (YjgF/YER057c/UK114 family)